jgi:endo-1,4-beta-xylanase
MFLRSSGTPVYKIIGEEKIIHIGHRLNNWDGIDIRLENMNLKQGNRYTIRVKGRVDGCAPPGMIIMLQIVPDFMWRHSVECTDNCEFTLSHTFSIMELQTAEAVRIATNTEGANVSFFIDEIKVLSKQLIQ